MNVQMAKALRTAPLRSPTDLKAEGVREITGALNILLADVFALYVKTKNFHWHVSGPHFRRRLRCRIGLVHRRPRLTARFLQRSACSYP